VQPIEMPPASALSQLTKTSSPSGKTPTPTFPFWKKPRPNTRSCS